MMDHKKIQEAALAIEKADAVLIGAGAGMGVDSGLPNFRGPEGFWEAYRPYKKLGLNFQGMANPALFSTDPELAWGFYGHRLKLYRTAQPHRGFEILKEWASKKAHGAFVYTSNVDCQFQKAGFSPERVAEIHGSIHWLQCTQNCGIEIYPAGDLEIKVDETTMKAVGSLPHCPNCGALARPNILMFGDWTWNDSRTGLQEAAFEDWLNELEEAGARPVVVELGAGTAIPTIRYKSEDLVSRFKTTLIRINPDEETKETSGQISLPLGAKAALVAIQELLGGKLVKKGFY